MKLMKLRLKNKAIRRRTTEEDLRYLQKKISGRSVYKRLSSMYVRSPKHKKLRHSYQD